MWFGGTTHSQGRVTLRIWAQISPEKDQVRGALPHLGSGQYRSGFTTGVWWEQIPPPALRPLRPTPKPRSESKPPHSPPLHTQRAFRVVRSKIKSQVGYFNFSSHFQPLGCIPGTLGSFLLERRVLELIFPNFSAPCSPRPRTRALAACGAAVTPRGRRPHPHPNPHPNPWLFPKDILPGHPTRWIFPNFEHSVSPLGDREVEKSPLCLQVESSWSHQPYRADTPALPKLLIRSHRSPRVAGLPHRRDALGPPASPMSTRGVAGSWGCTTDTNVSRDRELGFSPE